MDTSPQCHQVQSFYSKYGKPFDRERVSLAHQILSGIPEERINLMTFIRKSIVYETTVEPDCGTIACAVGWLSMNPTFQKKTGLLPGNVWGDGDTHMGHAGKIYCENGVRHRDFQNTIDFYAGALALATEEVRAKMPRRPQHDHPVSRMVSEMGVLLFNSGGGSAIDDAIRDDREVRQFLERNGYTPFTDKGLALSRLKLVYDHLSQ